jgi:hypothetical protein
LEKSNFIGGALTVACALAGGAYLARSLVRALSVGFSPGRLGAIHSAWSAQYCVFIAACCIGIGFALILSFMGLRWAGVIKDANR